MLGTQVVRPIELKVTRRNATSHLVAALLVISSVGPACAEPSSLADASAVSEPISSPTASPANSAFKPSRLPALGRQEPPVLTLVPALRPAPKEALTLSASVKFAAINYPTILRAQAQTNAARINVTAQKLHEYVPDGLIQFQEVMASHNKLTQIIYGSPVFPANPGPGFPTVGMNPMFFSGLGYNIDWAPIDFGLHKARIQLSKQQYGQAVAQQEVTLLDVELAAANAFLDTVEAHQQVVAAEQNVASFDEFSKVVEAQVKAQLKPGADLALAQAELANARNQLFRAQLNLDIARINLANSIGCNGFDVTADDRGLICVAEPVQQQPVMFDTVPILKAAKASLLTSVAQRHVLAKEYFPTFHFMGGWQLRGAALNTKGVLTNQDAAGTIPTVPNYQAAVIVNWNFLDYFALRAEKHAQDQRVAAQQQELRLVLQNLQAEDARSRARVKIALDIAGNMPVQVESARQASEQAQARYKVGLSSVAQVAEANQVLAQSRMQEAVAYVGVWRAMLGMSAAHGDIGPFIAQADRVQKGM